MITYLFLKYEDNDYKFPIGTNILTGRLLRKLIKQFMSDTIALQKYTRLWLGGHYVSDDTILIYDEEKVVLFTDEWGASEENGLIIPSIITTDVLSPVLYIE